MNNKLLILHITPHLGGGIGSVVLNWIKKDIPGNFHTIISLDKNNNKDWKDINNFYEQVVIHDDCFVMKDFKGFFKTNIEQADIVIIHYWNHPLLYNVMINFQWPSCRLLLWCHVNGLFPPYNIPEKLFNFVDCFIFTSPVSYDCKEVKNLSDVNKEKISVIWSTVGTEDYDDLERIPHSGFNVGYVGTADFGKLNHNFINLCSKVNIPDVRFIVISGDSQQHLINEAIDADIWEKFTFLGHVPRVPDIPRVLSKIDVFGYPLQPQNFATCEQALGEAMMAGCVPVVFANLPEKHIIKHMETGIIAVTLEEYPHAIEYLYKNPDVLARISENARVYAKHQYDINKAISNWNKTFERTMELEKREHIWDSMKIGSYLPFELYIESLGGMSGYGCPFLNYLNASDTGSKKSAVSEIQMLFRSNPIFFSKNKGSVIQYNYFFPDDGILNEWKKLIIEEGKNELAFGKYMYPCI
jgi:glycosyltransferase involved in cell wall biosynthesis